MTYAGFGKRFAAWFIDYIVLYFLGYFIQLSVISSAQLDPDFRKSAIKAVVVSNAFIFVWLYNSVMESSKLQATLGKMALDIVVTDIDGKRISFYQATGRYFAKLLSIIILGIGFLMIAFTDKKQGLHDKIADTLVVNKETQADSPSDNS